jgi:serine/threonine-protein kinase
VSEKPGRLAKERSRPDSRDAATGAALTTELLEPAVDRLRLLAAFFAVFIVLEGAVSFAVQHFTGDHPPPSEQRWEAIGAGTAFAILLSLYLAIRTRALSTRRLLYLGIVCWIALALVLSFADHADYFWRDGHRLHGIPWVCLFIMLVPFFFPISTTAVALTGLAMAAAGPAAMWILSRVLDLDAPLLGAYLDVFIPGVLATLLALIPARVIQRLGAEVREARRLGSYVLEERLGQGGMGEVWRAQHRLLARQAAVKLIKPSALGESSGVRERFAREAQATASLRSPHTVALYDYGFSDDGHLYYAMELLDGLDLERLVQRFGAQPVSRVIPWLRQVCHSLHEAHRAGLVHRDIKPANIFVCRYGVDYDFVKVLDFGIVALRGDTWTDDPQLTADGTICGTPAYMAPELASGRHPVDARTDIYALGCVMYWLLTGRAVFEGRSPVEVIAGHLERRPTPPSEVGSGAIPAELEALVLACLAKSPEDRPLSVAHLQERLEAVPIEDPWAPDRTAEWWDTHVPEDAHEESRSPANGDTSASADPDSVSLRDTPVRPAVRRDKQG